MSAIVRTINAYFKIATRSDVNELLSKIILSERQQRIFEMFYLKRQNIGYISDNLYISERVVSEELNIIRNKMKGAILKV